MLCGRFYESYAKGNVNKIAPLADAGSGDDIQDLIIHLRVSVILASPESFN